MHQWGISWERLFRQSARVNIPAYNKQTYCNSFSWQLEVSTREILMRVECEYTCTNYIRTTPPYKATIKTSLPTRRLMCKWFRGFMTDAPPDAKVVFAFDVVVFFAVVGCSDAVVVGAWVDTGVSSSSVVLIVGCSVVVSPSVLFSVSSVVLTIGAVVIICAVVIIGVADMLTVGVALHCTIGHQHWHIAGVPVVVCAAGAGGVGGAALVGGLDGPAMSIIMSPAETSPTWRKQSKTRYNSQLKFISSNKFIWYIEYSIPYLEGT